MIKESILDYLKTFFLTIFVTFLIILSIIGIIQYQVYHEKSQDAEDDFSDYYLVGVMIDKNKYLESKDPDNYLINLKLGTLYEIQKDYKNAESEYKTAITKEPYLEYKANYKLAALLINQNRLDDAQSVIDNIGEEPDETLIKYKAKIYAMLGDKYYDKSDYENAALKYQKALSYYNAINSREGKEVEGNIASAYVYLAEQKVKTMQIDDAINYLETANSIVNAPIIKYKLAILLSKSKPDTAFQYFEEVFDKAPELINQHDYKDFLLDMASNAIEDGNMGEAALYQYKAQKLDEYFKTNILSVDDIGVELAEGKIKLNKWTNKYEINLQIKIKNKSKIDMDSLYMYVTFKDKLKTLDEYSEQVINDKFKLYSGLESPIISVKTKIKHEKEDKHPHIITADVYVSKTEKSCKLYITTIILKEKVQKNPFKELFKDFGLLFNKITSKLPAFLF